MRPISERRPVRARPASRPRSPQTQRSRVQAEVSPRGGARWGAWLLLVAGLLLPCVPIGGGTPPAVQQAAAATHLASSPNGAQDGTTAPHTTQTWRCADHACGCDRARDCLDGCCCFPGELPSPAEAELAPEGKRGPARGPVLVAWLLCRPGSHPAFAGASGPRAPTLHFEGLPTRTSPEARRGQPAIVKPESRKVAPEEAPPRRA